MNAGKQNGKDAKGKRETAPDFDDVFNTPLVSTDLLPGQYPARLVGKTPVFMVKSKFDSSGKAPRFNFLFAVKNPATGHVVIVQTDLLPPPSRQATGGGVHSKSRLYKFLKPIANDDPTLWDVRADNVSGKATINSFIGRTCNVLVERDEEYTNVTAAIVAPIGTNFPSEEEAAEAIRTYEERAEQREQSAAPADRGTDGPPLDDEDARDAR